jgi:hypothetical protein
MKTAAFSLKPPSFTHEDRALLAQAPPSFTMKPTACRDILTLIVRVFLAYQRDGVARRDQTCRQLREMFSLAH